MTTHHPDRTTDLLVRELHDRVDTLSPPTIDARAVVQAGTRRVGRTRVLAAAGAAAVIAVTAGVGPSLLDEAGSTRHRSSDGFAAEFAAHTPTYAIGRTVHIGARTFTVDHDIRAFVQNDVGIVYADQHGQVHASDGLSETTVGGLTFRHEDKVLAADGDLAAWVETEPSLRLAVLDQASGKLQYTTLQPASQDEFSGPANVSAIDADTVYVTDDRGVLAVTDGSTDVIAPATDERRVSVDDVKNGVFAYAVNHTPASGMEAGDGGTIDYWIGPTLSGGHRLAHGSYGWLSPDGRHLVVEVSDGVPAVIDTATGQRLPSPTRAYDFQVGIGWIDDDAYAAMAIAHLPADGEEPAGGWRFDLLECSLSRGTCDATRTNLNPTTGDASLPIGADINGG